MCGLNQGKIDNVGINMRLLTLLTKLAENAHHQICVLELTKDQPDLIREAFVMNKNSQIRNILAGSEVNFPDRDEVVTIER